MEHIDSLGLFWLPGHEEDSDKLSGRLQFDPGGGGISLSLVGIFDNAVDDRGEPTVRIFGWLGNKPVTLDRCFSTGTNQPTPGVIGSSFHANRMFVGHHIESKDQRFQEAEATFGHTDVWVGRSGIDIQKDYFDRKDDTPIYTATFTPIAQQDHPFNRGRVKLGYCWKHHGDPTQGISMKQWPVFTIRYDEPRPLDDIEQDIRLLQNLITLCMDGPTDLDRLVLTHPDIHMFMLGGSDSGAEQPIDVIKSPIPYTSPDKRKPRYTHDMLLTFDDLGGLPTIARWLDVAPKFRRALNSLMSVKYAERMYAENRFLNATFGAESFHRLTQNEPYMAPESFDQLLNACLEAAPEDHREWLLGKIGFGNDPPLVKRLGRLAGRASTAVRPVIGEKRRWAGTLSDVRNELTHLNADSPEFDGGDLVNLTDSVYAVVRTCMLLDCGVSMEMLTRKASSANVFWYRGRLAQSIERVREQMRLLREARNASRMQADQPTIDKGSEP
ncbi:HEPN domain-containing protein [Dactylosporangium sp. CS-033363]|uniref:ApeA N-terminal domain 1-containing protein n=1 Tax=Dactylosporangium sp. CS-033363 TaxID=3239935 RepID=UPI003D90F88B